MENLWFAVILSASVVKAQGQTFSTLHAGGEIYTNVQVTSVTATHVFFSHVGGLANAKLKNLDTHLQEIFRFDATRASSEETKQIQANALYTKLAQVSSARKVDSEDYRTPLSAVTISVSPPVVEYVRYDIGQPKPASVTPGFAGNTDYKMRCEPILKLHTVKKDANDKWKFRVDRVDLSLSLPITITVPLTVKSLLLAHEEGHRQISEQFYQIAAGAAGQAAESVLNREFTGYESDPATAERMVANQIEEEIQSVYWKYTLQPCRKAQIEYDALTDHGRNYLDPNRAVKEVVTKYVVALPVN